jgi:membrane protease YdiL (CAAX protease family)
MTRPGNVAAIPTSIWMLTAPAVMIVTLFGLHSVWAAFVFYHLGLCLLSPWLEARRRGRSWREHAVALGCRRPRTATGWWAGLLSGMLLGGAALLAFGLLDGAILVPRIAGDTLAGWGVSARNYPLLAFLLLLGAGPAEELFWRGFVQGRLAVVRGERRAILTTALGFTVYHVLTLAALTRSALWTAAGAVLVCGAGVFWGWLREREASVWPAALSHAGAAAGYLGVGAILLARIAS